MLSRTSIESTSEAKKETPITHKTSRNQKSRLVKLSCRFTELDLVRAAKVGQISWLSISGLLICWSVLIEFLRPNLWLLLPETYVINDAVDMGTISNIRHGNFGWPVFSLVLLAVSFVIIDLLASRSLVVLNITSTIVTLVFVSVIAACVFVLAEKLQKEKDAVLHVNLYVILVLVSGILMLFATIHWQLVTTIDKLDEWHFSSQNYSAANSEVSQL